jgi:hypothetical protein
MKKFLALTAFVFFISTQLFVPVALAQGTLLPKPQEGTMLCDDLLDDYKEMKDPKTEFIATVKENPDEANEVLGCAIKTGRVSFWMIPYFIVYIIEFIIGLSGLIAIIFVVIGGYQFIVSGATDQRDAAKTTIRNAVLGLVLVLTAWVIINIVQFVLTI